MISKLLWCAIGVALDRFAYSADAPTLDEKTVSVLEEADQKYNYRAEVNVGGEVYSLSYNFLDNAFMTGYITISYGMRRVTLSVTTEGDHIVYGLNPSTHYEFHMFHGTSFLGIVVQAGAKRLLQSLTVRQEGEGYAVDIVNCRPVPSPISCHQLHILTIASGIRKRPVALKDLVFLESGNLTMIVCTRDDRTIIILDRLDARKRKGTVEILNSEYGQTFHYEKNRLGKRYYVEDRHPGRDGAETVQDLYEFRIQKNEIVMTDADRPYRYRWRKNTLLFL